jgi:vancomycin permeability regulator SanA
MTTEEVKEEQIEETTKTESKQRHFVVIQQHKKLILALIVIFFSVLWGPTIYANLSTRSVRYDLAKTSVNAIPRRNVAIVFGAGVLPNGTPSPYLLWRVESAVQLYKAGRVQKLLMSGDNSSTHYNEPVVMQKIAISLGVKPSDIVLDYAGYSTYDTCYRAKAIFGLSQATLVSQGYHLPRAIMTCDGLGVQSIGVSAVHAERSYTLSYIVREWISTDKSVVQNIFKPHPTLLGKPEPIHY